MKLPLGQTLTALLKAQRNLFTQLATPFPKAILIG